VGLSQRLAGASEDRVHRPRADPRAEQLLAELHNITARDTVASREGRDGRVKTGTKRALGNLGRQHAACLLTAARAAHPSSTMLGDMDLCHGQLLDLPAHRLTHRDPLPGREGVTTPTALGPILDHPVHRPRRQERATLALVTGLGALRTARRILPPPRRNTRRISARRRRRVPRTPIQPPLQHSDPLILTSDTLSEHLNLSIHPQKHLHHDLPALVIDRLRLRTLHTKRFDTPRLCPPTN
jgi:hypothetical protein